MAWSDHGHKFSEQAGPAEVRFWSMPRVEWCSYQSWVTRACSSLANTLTSCPWDGVMVPAWHVALLWSVIPVLCATVWGRACSVAVGVASSILYHMWLCLLQSVARLSVPCRNRNQLPFPPKIYAQCGLHFLSRLA